MPSPYLQWLGGAKMVAKMVEDADSEEQQNPTGEDHAAHAVGKTCKRCGQVIEADQAARLRGVDDWVHDMCPS